MHFSDSLAHKTFFGAGKDVGNGLVYPSSCWWGNWGHKGESGLSGVSGPIFHFWLEPKIPSGYYYGFTSSPHPPPGILRAVPISKWAQGTCVQVLSASWMEGLGSPSHPSLHLPASSPWAPGPSSPQCCGQLRRVLRAPYHPHRRLPACRLRLEDSGAPDITTRSTQSRRVPRGETWEGQDRSQMLIKRKVRSVFVNWAVRRFLEDNNRHILLGFQETSEKIIVWWNWLETCFLIHKLSQKRLSNATILIPNASIYCGVQARTSFFFLPPRLGSDYQRHL